MGKPVMLEIEAGVLGIAPETGAARSYPAKSLHLISTYPPGGGTDAAANILALLSGDQFGQQFIVGPRGEASCRTGTELPALAVPDGDTVMLGEGAPLAIPAGASVDLPHQRQQVLQRHQDRGSRRRMTMNPPASRSGRAHG